MFIQIYIKVGTLKPTVPNFWVKMYTILPAQLKVQFPEPVFQNRISLLFFFTAFDYQRTCVNGLGLSLGLYIYNTFI